MKKLLLLLLCVPLIYSCGKAQSAKEINVLEINDKCELLDVYIIVVDELIELTDKYGKSNLNNLPIEEIEKFEMLKRKLKEIEAVNWKEGWNYKQDVYKDFGEHCENLKEFKKSQEYMFSFFEVNQTIVKTTESLNDKNTDIYSDFESATNQVKVKPYKDLAFQIKTESDKLVEMIQEMKYSLVLAVDKKVYLGQYLDDEGEPIESNSTESEYTDLTPSQKKMKIAELSNKDDRVASTDLFNPENKQGASRILDKKGNGLATQLRGNVESFRVLLSNILKTAEDSSWIKQGSSRSLQDEIDKTLKLHDKYGKKQNES